MDSNCLCRPRPGPTAELLFPFLVQRNVREKEAGRGCRQAFVLLQPRGRNLQSNTRLPNLFTLGHTWKITFVQHTAANMSGYLPPKGLEALVTLGRPRWSKGQLGGNPGPRDILYHQCASWTKSYLGISPVSVLSQPGDLGLVTPHHTLCKPQIPYL